MPFADLFDVEKQLSFYGAYHSNKVNVFIHMTCVPILLWSALVILTELQLPKGVFPEIHHKFNDYLIFELNLPSIVAVLYVSYYLTLDFAAALLYIPQMAISLLTATAFAESDPEHIQQAAYIHAAAWVAQFLGHGVAEKRAPALKDNILGAVVLAPFFVHLEALFHLGYRPAMKKRLDNEIGKEIATFRREQKEARRAAKAERDGKKH